MQGEHEEEEVTWTQKKCVGEKEQESRNSTYEVNDGGSELMMDPACAAPEEGAESGEQARRAAVEARDGDGVGETQRQAEEAEV